PEQGEFGGCRGGDTGLVRTVERDDPGADLRGGRTDAARGAGVGTLRPGRGEEGTGGPSDTGAAEHSGAGAEDLSPVPPGGPVRHFMCSDPDMSCSSCSASPVYSSFAPVKSLATTVISRVLPSARIRVRVICSPART